MTDIHTCSYYCDRPNCIKHQRDELREALFAKGNKYDAAGLAKRLDKMLGTYADAMPKEAYFEVDAVMRALNGQCLDCAYNPGCCDTHD
jgi:hypothetical protein